MIEAVYVGTLAPLLFLILVLKDANRRLILFLVWGLTAALGAYYLNAFFRDALGIPTEYVSTRVAPAVEELLKAATAILAHGIFNSIAAIPSAWFACVLVPTVIFAIEFLAWNIFGRKSASLPPALAKGVSK